MLNNVQIAAFLSVDLHYVARNTSYLLFKSNNIH